MNNNIRASHSRQSTVAEVYYLRGNDVKGAVYWFTTSEGLQDPSLLQPYALTYKLPLARQGNTNVFTTTEGRLQPCLLQTSSTVIGQCTMLQCYRRRIDLLNIDERQ